MDTQRKQHKRIIEAVRRYAKARGALYAPGQHAPAIVQEHEVQYKALLNLLMDTGLSVSFEGRTYLEDEGRILVYNMLDVNDIESAPVPEGADLILHLQCACGHKWDVEPASVYEERKHYVRAIYGSDAEFCPRCDSSDDVRPQT